MTTSKLSSLRGTLKTSKTIVELNKEIDLVDERTVAETPKQRNPRSRKARFVKKQNPKVMKLVKVLEADRQVLAVYLFGSQASGKANEMSDLDIAVVLRSHEKEHEYEILSLSSPGVDIVIFNSAPPFLKFEIMSRGIRLFVRNIHDLNHLELMAMKEYHEHVPLYESFGVGG